MDHSEKTVLVSACLLGLNTKYNGANNKNPDILSLLPKVLLIPFCPEQLGGLATPRPAAEMRGGDGHDVLDGRASVETAQGVCRTAAFIRGAEEALRLAGSLNVGGALLKARSPSCGSGRIYDGSFSGSLRPGDGVTAALFKRKGIIVFTEDEFGAFLEWLNPRDG